MKTFIDRFKSPMVWIAIIGLLYSTVLVPKYPELPNWTAIVGYIATLLGVANNPCDKKNF